MFGVRRPDEDVVGDIEFLPEILELWGEPVAMDLRVYPSLGGGLLDEIGTLQRSASRNLNLQMALETVLLRMRDVLGATAATTPAR